MEVISNTRNPWKRKRRKLGDHCEKKDVYIRDNHGYAVDF